MHYCDGYFKWANIHTYSGIYIIIHASQNSTLFPYTTLFRSDRAQTSLDLVRRETGAEQARARRGFTLALARLERDRRLLSSADRVAAMSLQAYAEGVVALPNVLEAQRNAREALARYVDDVAAANDAAAAVRLLTATESP